MQPYYQGKLFTYVNQLLSLIIVPLQLRVRVSACVHSWAHLVVHYSRVRLLVQLSCPPRTRQAVRTCVLASALMCMPVFLDSASRCSDSPRFVPLCVCACFSKIGPSCMCVKVACFCHFVLCFRVTSTVARLYFVLFCCFPSFL